MNKCQAAEAAAAEAGRQAGRIPGVEEKGREKTT